MKIVLFQNDLRQERQRGAGVSGNVMATPRAGTAAREERAGSNPSRPVGFHLRGLATTLASLPYLLNHLPVLQKTLVQALPSESLSAVSQEKQLNPQGGN